MCRLAAYSGSPLGLDAFLLRPSHSLIHQAHAPRETLSATVNADGLGVGWYDDDHRPAAYRTLLPAWADPNLEPLGRSLTRPLWLANVRSATDPLSSGYANTQPFHDDRLMFLHNGYVADFGERLRGRLRAFFRTSIESGIKGTTDSEYLFAALRQALADAADGGLDTAVRSMLTRVSDWCEDGAAMLNTVVSDGQCLIAVRHAVNAACPSLYLRESPTGRTVASEPLEPAPDWVTVPPHHLVVIKPGSDIHFSAL